MFNIGPMEFLVLAVVGLIVLGPDRLPGLARDAARMIRTLRDMAVGARTQLRDELGPEFADVDLRNLHPKNAIRNVLLGNEDLSGLDPRTSLRDAIMGNGGVDVTKPASRPAQPPGSPPLTPGEPAPFDTDAT
jgi:sec-independent protein translocase protein TatB